jgi:ankyrin repeat protein
LQRVCCFHKTKKQRITELLISRGSLINEVDANGNTCIHLASENGNFETLKFLLSQKKININSENKDQSTSLHLSCLNGHLNICNLLIENGAKLDCLDSMKRTPLHFASSQGHVEVVRLLIERGADTSIRDDKMQYEKAQEGKTALDLASESIHYHKVSKIFKEAMKRKREYTQIVDKIY